MADVYHDEVEIEDFEFDEDNQTYYYPCPCGDKYVLHPCPSCLMLKEIKMLIFERSFSNFFKTLRYSVRG